MLQTLAVSGYRSLRAVVLELGPLVAITGPNGSGKSSLYKALRLLADVAHGEIIATLAREGGLEATMWAGPEWGSRSGKQRSRPQGTVATGPSRLCLGFATEDMSYAIDLGLPIPSRSMFDYDPEIKREAVWAGPVLRRGSLLADRNRGLVQITDVGVMTQTLAPFDSMLSHCADPINAPELFVLRDRIRRWRFYDGLRTDRFAPARSAQVGTRTNALAHDGTDLAAAIQTICETGDADGLHRAVDDAFPGSRVEVVRVGALMEVALSQPGLLRPMRAAELSDGTLRYLLLVAALFSPRPPELLVLNEPETSLHLDLLPALARMIGQAARRSQVVVVSHSQILIEHLGDGQDLTHVALEKDMGETVIKAQDLLSRPAWNWPSR